MDKRARARSLCSFGHAAYALSLQRIEITGKGTHQVDHGVCAGQGSCDGVRLGDIGGHELDLSQRAKRAQLEGALGMTAAHAQARAA